MDPQNQQQKQRNIRIAPLRTPTDLGEKATKDISAALNLALADVYAIYFKTKNFHWHMSGVHFRDLHLLLDEQALEIFEMTDKMAERVRKVGGTTLHSIGHVSRLQRIADNDADFVTPQDMLSELCQDNRAFTTSLRVVRQVCSDHRDNASVSLIDTWIDESERRSWFLYEMTRQFHS
jgi:starvation-inducible DNA-binding protein